MKAILVIDMPENCEDCPLFRTDEDFNATIHYCMPYREKELFMVKEKGISKDCPLKPLPRRMYPRKNDNFIVSIGWNMCLDEILGEEE